MRTWQIYLKMYDRPLLMDVLDETGGSLRKFLIRVLLGTRDEGTTVDPVAAENAAEQLNAACNADPSVFWKFLTGDDPKGDVGEGAHSRPATSICRC